MKESTQNLGFCRLPFELLQDENLTAIDAIVYSVLLDFCVNELQCSCKISDICRLSGVSGRSVRRSLAHLERCEYVEHERTGKESVYRLADIIGLKRQKSRPTIRQTKILSVPEQQEIKLLYGEYKRVALTVDQFDKLVQDFGQQRAAEYIKRCDEYCQRTGKTYADYDLTIRKWIADDQTDADGMTEKERQKMAEYMSVVNRFEKV